MITLSKSGNSVTFTFDENSGYLQNGTIDVPVNSLALITDESDMATFRKAASNDIFVSARYEEFGMSKSELESWYKENMVGSTGGGGGVDSGTVQTMIDESISGKADTSAVTVEISEAVSGKADSSAVTAEISAAVSGKQDTLIAGDNITISGNVISAEGGKAITAGRAITVTTGATADTVAFNLPISAGTSGIDSLNFGNIYNRATSMYAVAQGSGTTASASYAHSEGIGTVASGSASHAEGESTVAGGNDSHAEGKGTVAKGYGSHAEGGNTIANNLSEHASGRFNVSNTGNTSTFGHSGNTLFSVGNGTADNARHNALEVRQNGDIYCNNGTSDVKLQDYIQYKLVQITQSAYDDLVNGGTVDNSTIYYIVN